MNDEEDYSHCYERSFSAYEDKKKIRCWSSKNTLKPHQVAKNCNKKFWFDCDKCPHEFSKALDNVNKGQWCPYCAGRKICGEEDCSHCYKRSFSAYEDKKKIRCWSSNNTEKPRQVAKNSHKKFLFDCDKCPHEFSTALNKVNGGNWCPYCAGKKICDKEDCSHCYERSFSAYEDKKKIRCWSSKNTLKPHQVAKNCNKKFWFDCDEEDCSHEFSTSLNSVNRGNWCPYCVNKTEKKFRNYLVKNLEKLNIKKIIYQFSPVWAKKPGITKRSRYYKYDFFVELGNGKVVVVEIDGPQHYKLVSDWHTRFCREDKKQRVGIYDRKTQTFNQRGQVFIQRLGSPERDSKDIQKHIRSTDILLYPQLSDKTKENLALQHNHSLIRLNQEDIYRNKGNWKTLFVESLSDISASLVPKKIDHADSKRYEKILRKRWIRNEGKLVLKPSE